MTDLPPGGLPPPVERGALAGDVAEAARSLLGCLLVSTAGGARVVVRLTEVEAYGGAGADPGSHAFRGRSPRNATMFGPAGHAYVYFTYGMHWCLNVVTGPAGSASAVLLRAGEVVDGLAAARARRTTAHRDAELARGPARLTVALGVTGTLDGTDVCAAGGPLLLRGAPCVGRPDVVVSARTGVAGAGAGTLWRFHLPDEPTVSPYRPAAARRPAGAADGGRGTRRGRRGAPLGETGPP